MLFLIPRAVWDPAWIAALGTLITAAGGLIGALVGSLHTNRKNSDKLKRITEQVENNHGERNLRDDVDKVIHGQMKVENTLEHVHESVKALAHSVGEARAADAIIHDDYAARLRRLEQAHSA